MSQTELVVGAPTRQKSVRTNRGDRTQDRDLVRLLSAPLLIFLLLPIAALILRTSPTHLVANLALPQTVQAVRLSLTTTLATALLTIVFGTPVAFLLARRKNRWHRIIDAIVDLPLVLPPAVAGVALLMAFGRRGLLGSYLDMLGINIAFTQIAVILAQMFISAPFYIKSASVGFASIEPELKEAAALDGASRVGIIQHVTIPLSSVALLSGTVMTWARALGEFGATIIFAGNYPGRTQTMPLAIYLGFELDLDVALTLSVILIGCAFLVLLIVKYLLVQDA